MIIDNTHQCLQDNVKFICVCSPDLYDTSISVTFFFVSVTLSNSLSSVKFAALNQFVMSSPSTKMPRPNRGKKKYV